MKRIGTTTFAVAALLTATAWAEHGPGGLANGGHGGPPPLADAGSSHSGRSHSDSRHSSTPDVDSHSSNFATRLANNTSLSTRLQALLPPNTTLADAAQGFKNQGQFIAALHVSHNLNIPFDQLKMEMTGPDHDSLGKAIRDLRPDLNTKTAGNNVKLAQNQAKTDVEESGEPAETGGK